MATTMFMIDDDNFATSTSLHLSGRRCRREAGDITVMRIIIMTTITRGWSDHLCNKNEKFQKARNDHTSVCENIDMRKTLTAFALSIAIFVIGPGVGRNALPSIGSSFGKISSGNPLLPTVGSISELEYYGREHTSRYSFKYAARELPLDSFPVVSADIIQSSQTWQTSISWVKSHSQPSRCF